MLIYIQQNPKKQFLVHLSGNQVSNVLEYCSYCFIGNLMLQRVIKVLLCYKDIMALSKVVKYKVPPTLKVKLVHLKWHQYFMDLPLPLFLMAWLTSPCNTVILPFIVNGVHCVTTSKFLSRRHYSCLVQVGNNINTALAYGKHAHLSWIVQGHMFRL